MKNLFSLFICFFSISAFAQREQWKPLDDKYGFKDISFEVKESAFAKNKKFIKIASTEKGLVSYKILDPGYLLVGDCVLKSVEVGFFKDSLMVFYIETKGFSNSKCFLDAFNSSYGQGFQSNKYLDNFAWLGYKVTAMYNTLNTATGDGYMSITSNSVRKEYDDYIEKQAKANGSDL